MGSRKPPGDVNGTYPFGMLVVDPPRDDGWKRTVDDILSGLNREGTLSGVRITPVGHPVKCSCRLSDMQQEMSDMISRDGARFIVVLLCGSDIYAPVKLAADRLGVVTQCVRFDKIRNKIPGGYFGNVMLKINAKLGGTNHTIASRYTESDLAEYRGFVAKGDIVPVFQDPPASLSWVMDKHCMIVGIDVSHPGKDSLLPWPVFLLL